MRMRICLGLSLSLSPSLMTHVKGFPSSAYASASFAPLEEHGGSERNYSARPPAPCRNHRILTRLRSSCGSLWLAVALPCPCPILRSQREITSQRTVPRRPALISSANAQVASELGIMSRTGTPTRWSRWPAGARTRTWWARLRSEGCLSIVEHPREWSSYVSVSVR
jgi:hypothetical protein